MLRTCRACGELRGCVCWPVRVDYFNARAPRALLSGSFMHSSSSSVFSYQLLSFFHSF